MHGRKILALGGVLVACALAACGGGNDDGQAKQTGAPPDTSTAKSATAPDSTSGQNAANAGLKPLDTQGGAVEAGPALTVDSAASVGIFLADKTGRPLYMYTADKPGESVCYEGCAQRWPPVLALQGTPSAGAAQVDASKLGTIQRRDGNAQVTYAGHPLYYYQRDQGSAGQPQGNDVKDSAGEWYLVTPAGEKAGH